MPGETIEAVASIDDLNDAIPAGSENKAEEEPGAKEANGTDDPGDVAPATLAILDAIRSGNADPQKLLMTMLGSQVGDQPEVGMLLKLMSEENGHGEDELREQIREELREEHAEAFTELSVVAERLLTENEKARERLDSLAAAIGACPICFGEDLLCDMCRGAGEPGSRAPQPDEFHRYVRPAVARVRAALGRSPVRRPWPRKPQPDFAGPETSERARAGARP